MGPSELAWKPGCSLESVRACRGRGQSNRSLKLRNGLGSHQCGSVAGERGACGRDRKTLASVEFTSELEGLKVQLRSLDLIQSVRSILMRK